MLVTDSSVQGELVETLGMTDLKAGWSAGALDVQYSEIGFLRGEIIV
jgi:hypothetical protein